MAARLPVIVGSKCAAGVDVSCECFGYQVEVSASGWSLVQWNPTECDVSECDHESWTMRRPWPTGDYSKKKKKHPLKVRNAFLNALINQYLVQILSHMSISKACIHQCLSVMWL